MIAAAAGVTVLVAFGEPLDDLHDAVLIVEQSKQHRGEGAGDRPFPKDEPRRTPLQVQIASSTATSSASGTVSISSPGWYFEVPDTIVEQEYRAYIDSPKKTKFSSSVL